MLSEPIFQSKLYNYPLMLQPAQCSLNPFPYTSNMVIIILPKIIKYSSSNIKSSTSYLYFYQNRQIIYDISSSFDEQLKSNVKAKEHYFIQLYFTYKIQHKHIYKRSIIFMETFSKSFQTSSRPEDYHSKCVCQICTCHHHKCPESHVHIPMNQTTRYQNQYVRHPINKWPKLPAQKAKPYKPYDYINSSYRQNYPGHKPQMRQKIIPRVKNQNKNVPFSGVSQYKLNYPGKSVQKDILRNKDKQFNPDKQPFYGYTTYRNDFIKKRPNRHSKPDKTTCDFPRGYKFDSSTTYGNSYIEKGFCSIPSFKPVQRVPPKGSHDLTSMYQQDFGSKKMPQVCPIHILPSYPKQIQYPNQHVTYSKFSSNWEQK